MKNNSISNLLEQIRQLDELLILHKADEDDFMLKQYNAKKNVFLKQLVSELIMLNETTPKVFFIIKEIVNSLEKTTTIIQESELSKKNHFSLIDLETVVREKLPYSPKLEQ